MEEFTLIGFALLLIGILLILVGSVGKAKGGIAFWVGPIPIIWANDRNTFYVTLILSFLTIVLTLLLMKMV